MANQQSIRANIKLFRETFRGREDIVARRWCSSTSGRSGYSPMCKNDRVRDICQKPCHLCANASYIPLSEKLLEDHLNGKEVLGVYPLLPDSTCHFIAGDFDNHNGNHDPLSDVKACYKIAHLNKIPCYILRSRSGKGYHVYFFFSSPVPARKARTVFFSLLEEAGIIGQDEKISSFDRLFPSQDELSGRGFGNLIALPLQGKATQQGHTLLLDPSTGFQSPLQEQWAALAEIKKIDESTLDLIIDRWELRRDSTQKKMTIGTELNLDPVPEGKRNDTLTRLIGKWIREGFDLETIHLISFGWNSRLEKPLSEDEVRQIIRSISKADEANNPVEELNKRHAVVMLGGRCAVINESFDHALNRPCVTFSKLSDFKNYYSNRKISISVDGRGRSREISIAQVWLESPRRRQYSGVVFSPGRDIPGHYNLFKGFAVEPKRGDWSLFRQHIFEVIANRIEEIFIWILAWVARIFQEPSGGRSGTSIVLRGKQGTGKGCFATQIGTIIGSHFLHITNQSQLTGRFNSHLKDCLLAFVDEGFWAGDRSSEGSLKAIVTEDYIICEPKFQDAFTVRNYINLIIASNHSWVVPAGLDERRFFVLDVSDARAQNRSYFEKIHKQMDCGGREAMLYELLQMDISGIDLRTFPRTDALLDQITHTMQPHQHFWYQKILDGSISQDDHHWPSYVICQELYRSYLEFAKSLGHRHLISNNQFGKELKKLCSPLKKSRMSMAGKTRPWVYLLPDLSTCRREFEKLVKTEIPWNGNDEGEANITPN